MPIPRLRTGKRTPQHHQVASIQDPEEELNNISSVPSNKHLFKRATTPNKGKHRLHFKSNCNLIIYI
jgi:hypothetical protein